LFLGNLGILPVRTIWTFSPVVLICVGVARVVRCAGAFGKFFGIFLIVFGTLFLLINLNVLHLRSHDPSWPLSLLLITFGMAMLARRMNADGVNMREPGFLNGFFKRPAGSYEHALRDWAVFGSLKRRLDTAAFEGGEAACLFGSIEIDLRRARISPAVRSVTVEATAVFGQVKIRVGEGWKVNVTGAGVLGSFEDKTIPPVTPDDAPVLIITGLAVFGSVEIED
jgi:predicted membrane protein